ncbi:MAG: hypothetical protein KatS3mg065_0466 [Chloroflexota bacterium]|nr:MAG: hypothetical protein KatS3mg065_0466 [Chloroflexota bacterium]
MTLGRWRSTSPGLPGEVPPSPQSRVHGPLRFARARRSGRAAVRLALVRLGLVLALVGLGLRLVEVRRGLGPEAVVLLVALLGAEVGWSPSRPSPAGALNAPCSAAAPSSLASGASVESGSGVLSKTAMSTPAATSMMVSRTPFSSAGLVLSPPPPDTCWPLWRAAACGDGCLPRRSANGSRLRPTRSTESPVSKPVAFPTSVAVSISTPRASVEGCRTDEAGERPGPRVDGGLTVEVGRLPDGTGLEQVLGRAGARCREAGVRHGARGRREPARWSSRFRQRRWSCRPPPWWPSSPPPPWWGRLRLGCEPKLALVTLPGRFHGLFPHLAFLLAGPAVAPSSAARERPFATTVDRLRPHGKSGNPYTLAAVGAG